MGVVEAIKRKHDGRKNGGCILATVDEMREHVPGIFVSAKTLQKTPNRRQRCEEAEQTGVVGVALRWVIPAVCVKTEEQLNILLMVSRLLSFTIFDESYRSCICERTVNITKEEIPKLNGIEAG
jgi:hypothetical protein